MAPSNDSTLLKYRIRTHRPGDMGTIVSYHGSQYAQEYGWDTSCESSAARLVADFLDNYDPNLERVFIAESVETSSQFLGCVAIFKHQKEANTAQLRLFLVKPAARGIGLGARLVDECIAFARDRGYKKIVLWTVSVLEGARRLYRRAGFQLVSTDEERDLWGVKLTPEIWELALSSTESQS